jgi:cytochrome c556
LRRIVAALSAGFCGAIVAVASAEAPQAPTLSTVASAELLTAAAQEYLADLKPLLVDEASYTKNAQQIGFKANAVTAIAHFLGKHDAASPLKGAAVEIMNSSKELTRAKDYAAAKAAWDKLQAATAPGAAAGPAPSWDRTASLGRMMEEISAMNGKLKRNLRRLDRTKDDNLRSAAVLAAFAQVGVYDTHEVKNEADFPTWYAMMTEMLDACIELSKQYEKGDAAGVKTSLDRLEKSCATCHDKFHSE